MVKKKWLQEIIDYEQYQRESLSIEAKAVYDRINAQRTKCKKAGAEISQLRKEARENLEFLFSSKEEAKKHTKEWREIFLYNMKQDEPELRSIEVRLEQLELELKNECPDLYHYDKFVNDVSYKEIKNDVKTSRKRMGDAHL